MSEEFEQRLEKLESSVESLKQDKEELSQQNRLLKKGIEKLKSSDKEIGREETKENTRMSRRSFLRKIGAGAIGLGALSLAPAAGKLTITDTGIEGSSGLDFLDSGSQYFKINDGGPVEVQNTDLRIPTGNSLEDGGGVNRVSFNSSHTNLYDDAGNRAIQLNDGIANIIFAESGQPVRIEDEEGSFVAAKYNTSSSAPGTFDLKNAVLSGKHMSMTGSSDAGNSYDTWRSYSATESQSGKSMQAAFTERQTAVPAGTATTIFDTDQTNISASQMFCFVSGRSDSAERWMDIVLFAGASGVTLVASEQSSGSGSRSYAHDGDNGLELTYSGAGSGNDTTVEVTAIQHLQGAGDVTL